MWYSGRLLNFTKFLKIYILKFMTITEFEMSRYWILELRAKQWPITFLIQCVKLKRRQLFPLSVVWWHIWCQNRSGMTGWLGSMVFEFSVATQSADVRLTSADSSAPPRITAAAAESIRRGSTTVSHWGKALRPATRPVSPIVLHWSRAKQKQKAVGRSSLITCVLVAGESDIRWASPKLRPQLLI